MKTIEATITLRNNLLKTRRLETGLSQADFCRGIGVSPQNYNNLEALRQSPFTAHGVIRPIAQRLCDHYGCEPEDLWPDEILRIRRTKATVEIEAAQVPRIMCHPDPLRLLEVDTEPKEDLAVIHERDGRIARAVDGLPPRFRQAVRLHFGFEDGREWSYREIGEVLGVGVERTRQIVTQGQHRVEDAIRREIGDAFDLERKVAPSAGRG